MHKKLDFYAVTLYDDIAYDFVDVIVREDGNGVYAQPFTDKIFTFDDDAFVYAAIPFDAVADFQTCEMNDFAYVGDLEDWLDESPNNYIAVDFHG